MIPERMPSLRLPDAASDTNPTRVGPAEQPTSPARARRAKSAVPPFLSAADALLKEPGHIIPTDSPQREHPIKETTDEGAREMHR